MAKMTFGRGGAKVEADMQVWIAAIMMELDNASFARVVNRAAQINLEQAAKPAPNGRVWTP